MSRRGSRRIRPSPSGASRMSSPLSTVPRSNTSSLARPIQPCARGKKSRLPIVSPLSLNTCSGCLGIAPPQFASNDNWSFFLGNVATDPANRIRPRGPPCLPLDLVSPNPSHTCKHWQATSEIRSCVPEPSRHSSRRSPLAEHPSRAIHSSKKRAMSYGLIDERGARWNAANMSPNRSRSARLTSA